MFSPATPSGDDLARLALEQLEDNTENRREHAEQTEDEADQQYGFYYFCNAPGLRGPACAPEEVGVQQPRQTQKKPARRDRLPAREQYRIGIAALTNQNGCGLHYHAPQTEKGEREGRDNPTKPDPDRTAVFIRQSVRV